MAEDASIDDNVAVIGEDVDDKDMLQKLKAFKERNGHTKVPKHYSDDMQLAGWVTEQRRQFKLFWSAKNDEERAAMYKENTLTISAEMVASLKELGFEFSNKNPRHMRWDFRYQQLKEFSAKYGHAQVPIGWEENVKLANWVSTQRQEYKNMKKGRTSQLNDQRINLLNELGFAWEVQRGGRRRQLAPEASDSKNKSANSGNTTNEGLCILPGKAIVGGHDGAPMELLGDRNYSPKKKRKTGAGATSPQGQEQQYPQHMQQQQQQQQAFPGAQPGFWPNPGFPVGMMPQQGYFPVQGMNFVAAPFWPNMGMAPNMGMMPGMMFAPGAFPGYPFAPGMMQNPQMAMSSNNVNGPGGNSNNTGPQSFVPMHPAGYAAYSGYPMMPPQQQQGTNNQQMPPQQQQGANNQQMGPQAGHNKRTKKNNRVVAESKSKSNNNEESGGSNAASFQGKSPSGELDTSDALPCAGDSGPSDEAVSDQHVPTLLEKGNLFGEQGDDTSQ